jgi:hypothetical protein
LHINTLCFPYPDLKLPVPVLLLSLGAVTIMREQVSDHNYTSSSSKFFFLSSSNLLGDPNKKVQSADLSPEQRKTLN